MVVEVVFSCGEAILLDILSCPAVRYVCRLAARHHEAHLGPGDSVDSKMRELRVAGARRFEGNRSFGPKDTSRHSKDDMHMDSEKAEGSWFGSRQPRIFCSHRPSNPGPLMRRRQPSSRCVSPGVDGG